MKNIERLYSVIDNNLFMTTGKLDYDRLMDSFIKLCDLINDGEYDESLWYIGEYKTACLDNLIVGAYWHFTEWHSGQFSKSYQCLCLLGSIYQPNMASLDPENYGEYATYKALETMAG